MRWQGREESKNVEDRRGSGGSFRSGKSTGILGVIILLVGAYYGVDLSGLVGNDFSPQVTQQTNRIANRNSSLLVSLKWYWRIRRKFGALILNRWVALIRSQPWCFIMAVHRPLVGQGNLRWGHFIVRTITRFIWISLSIMR